MRMKAILQSACVAGLLSSPPCVGQTFGALPTAPEAPSFAPSGLLADPAIAKWLMTLPSDAAPERPDAELPVRAQLLDPAPIGGELYGLVMGARGAAEAPANGALSAQLFDADPIGGEAYRLARAVRPPQTVAENAANNAKPALQGRSVAKHNPRRSEKGQRVKSASPASRHRTSSCNCGLSAGRSVATSARRPEPRGEGHADLPAPWGPAGVVTIVPALGW